MIIVEARGVSESRGSYPSRQLLEDRMKMVFEENYNVRWNNKLAIS